MSQYVSENNLEQSISLDSGAAHLSIRFDNNVFFEPNSAVLTQAGKNLLDGIGPGIKAVKSSIKTCTVNGHTAKAISEVNDWDLSSGRAVSVVKYMDFRKVLETEQFRTKGSGYAEPIADNSTPEGMAQNRRVEMVLLRSDVDPTDPEVMKDILRIDYGIDLDQFDPDGDHSNNTDKVPERLRPVDHRLPSMRSTLTSAAECPSVRRYQGTTTRSRRTPIPRIPAPTPGTAAIPTRQRPSDGSPLTEVNYQGGYRWLMS